MSPREMDDAEQLAALRAKLGDDDLYAVLAESIDHLKGLVDGARSRGFTLYRSIIRKPSSVIHLCFYDKDGEEFIATISFKKAYERRSGKRLTFDMVRALNSAIGNLVLHCEGMDPFRGIKAPKR